MHATTTVDPQFLEALDKNGYCVVPQALDEEWIARLQMAFENAPVQSTGTQHVEVNKDTPELDAWNALEHHAALITAADSVLSRPYFVARLHGRNPLPGFGHQGLHADWPRAAGAPNHVLTALWMLDDFTVENGATRVVPGSHRLPHPPPKSLAQPLARHPHERIITGAAGSVLILNGYVWHSGRRNDSKGPRRAAQMGMHRGTKGTGQQASLSLE